MRHILLVDDEPEILEGLALIMRPLQGVTLHTACLAAQALRLMEAHPISLVIADIRMPGMNGIEMWEEIQRRAPDCRVIFLSGVRDFDHIYRVIQSPHARFLTKMEPEERILAAIRDALAELEAEERQRMEQRLARLRHALAADAPGEAEEAAFAACVSLDDAFALVTPAHKWALTAHEQQQALLAFGAALEESPVQACRFLPLEAACALCLFHPAQGEGLSALLEGVCAAVRRQLHFRCCYGMAPASLGQLRQAHQAFRAWHALEDAPLTLLRPAADLPALGEDARLQEQLRTLKGYLALGQRENFLLLLRGMLDDGAYQTREGLPALYFGVLALLDQHLAQAPELRETLRRERLFPSGTDAARQAAQDRLLRACAAAFDRLFPPEAYAQTDVVQSVRQYIRSHLAEDLSLNALSRRFALSPAYLSRMFSENTGQQLHAYIRQLRMSHAAHLLLSTGRRINAIAREVGYDSVHTFIRAFRKQYAMTPADYRAQGGPPQA